MLTNSPLSVSYSLDVIQEEVRHLLHKGVASRNQPIYTLWQHFPAREWDAMANELEQGGFLLRDRVGDLVALEAWTND